MRDRYYAGVGSRQTPLDVLEVMTEFARRFAREGLVLRSGGALGADSAFMSGAGTRHQIFTARDANSAALLTVDNFHPAPHKLTDYTRRLHARNAQILLGRDLQRPVDFVICWTPNGQVVGGTGQTIRIAEACGIPVVNLAN